MCGEFAQKQWPFSGAAISAGAMSARRRTESSVESQETHRFDRGEVQVSLPQSYETGVSKRKLFDVLLHSPNPQQHSFFYLAWA